MAAHPLSRGPGTRLPATDRARHRALGGAQSRPAARENPARRQGADQRRWRHAVPRQRGRPRAALHDHAQRHDEHRIGRHDRGADPVSAGAAARRGRHAELQERRRGGRGAPARRSTWRMPTTRRVSTSAARARSTQRTGYRSQSFLTVPLKNHDAEVVGVLQLINARSPGGRTIPFPAEDPAAGRGARQPGGGCARQPDADRRAEEPVPLGAQGRSPAPSTPSRPIPAGIAIASPS